MKPLDAGGPPADGPLDEADLAILDRIRAGYAAADPMPADPVDRIKFRITLRDLEFEVARLSAAEDRPVLAARGEEQSRTITFDSESLTIMIRVDANADGTARIDGWLAPPQDRTIEMKTPAGSLLAQSDQQGRFAFSQVPRGSAQLVVRPAGPARGSGRSVVTPALML